MFINISNHPASKWEEEQITAARQYGDIYEISFPDIDANAGEDTMPRISDALVIEVCKASVENFGVVIRG